MRVMKAKAIEGLHRVGVASEAPGLLRDMGYDPGPIVARAGVDLNLLADPDQFIPYKGLGRLFECCVAATGCTHFGVKLGARGGTRSLGLVGEIMCNSATLGDALESICLHQPRYIKGAVTYLITEADTAYWGYGVYESDTPASEQICDAAMGIAASIVRELTGRGPEHVLTSRARPDAQSVNAFREALGVVPEFNSDRHAAVVPKSWLRLPVSGADPERRAECEKMVERLWTEVEHTFSETVARHLRVNIYEGDVSAETVAQYFSLPLRTFNRRLEAEESTFRDLVKEARFVAAKQLLAITAMSVTDISLALGYKELGSFTRAFASLAGATPSEWRARLVDTKQNGGKSGSLQDRTGDRG